MTLWAISYCFAVKLPQAFPSNIKLGMCLAMLWNSVLRNYWRELYERHVDSASNDTASPDRNNSESPSLIVVLRRRIIRILVKIYPYYYSLHTTAKTTYHLLYLLNATPYWCLPHHILGLEYQRATESSSSTNQNSDYNSIGNQDVGEKPTSKSSLDTLKKFGVTLSWGTLYGLQLASWYYQQDFANSNGNSHSIAKLPPAPKLGVPGKARLLQDRTACNLCKNKCRNRAQSSGGYIFCYSCLRKYVLEHNCCPISRWPMHANAIRKLHLET